MTQGSSVSGIGLLLSEGNGAGQAYRQGINITNISMNTNKIESEEALLYDICITLVCWEQRKPKEKYNIYILPIWLGSNNYTDFQ